MPTKKKTKKPPKYKIDLEIGDEKLESAAETMLEALEVLPRPRKITTKAIFHVTCGDQVFHEVMMPHKAKRVFYPLARKLLAKNLTFLLSK